MTQTVDRFNEYCKEYDSLKENQLYYRKEIQELIQLLNEKLTSHYGKTIEVFWLDYIRDMIKFNNIDELCAQLEADKKIAEKF